MILILRHSQSSVILSTPPMQDSQFHMVCVRACVCACMRACVRACVRMRMCVRVMRGVPWRGVVWRGVALCGVAWRARARAARASAYACMQCMYLCSAPE